MDQPIRPLPRHLQATTDRFVAACRADAGVVAAFLHGSYASGTADVYSDLDLGLVTTNAAYDAVVAGSFAFVRQFGDPLFLETFARPSTVFFIFPDGTEGELTISRGRDVQHVAQGPYRVLLDTTGVLTGAQLTGDPPTAAAQRADVRRLVTWFWHDLSHCVTALGRGQLWWAQGQLEELRRVCVSLARLHHDGSAAAEAYDKIEQALPVARLAPLATTFGPLEPRPMLAAAVAIVRYYQLVAPQVARRHAIAYPAELERLLLARLEQLCITHGVIVHPAT